MAKDRLIFLFSFAFLGLVAAFLFRHSDAPNVQLPETKTVEVEQNGDKKSIVLAPQNDRNLDHLPGDGKIAVPYQLTNRSAVVQFINPGNYVDITFTSKDDIGFGRVSLTLLKDIKVLDIGKDSEGNKTNYYKSNSPTEILLEMTPKQAQVFSYAQLAGEVSLGIMEKAQNEQYGDLSEKLIQSESDGGFNSVLVTHMIRTLFPKADVKITATSKGYVISGKVSDRATAQNIIKVLDLMSTGSGEKSIVNLVEEHPESVEVLVANQELYPNDLVTSKDFVWQHMDVSQLNPSMITKNPQSEQWLNQATITNYIAKGEKIQRSDINWDYERNNKKVDTNPFAITPGKSVVPFPITTRSPIAQFLDPGSLVGIRFASNADVGFGTITLNLIDKVRVVSVGAGGGGRNFNKLRCYYEACAPLEVYLELTPHEADLLAYAQTAGNLSLELADNETPSTDNKLVHKLRKSESAGEFQSILVTHLIRELFPQVDIKITAAPKGYIIEGKVPDPQMASKILEILARLVPGGEKSMVSMLDVEPQQVLLCVKVLEVDRNIDTRLGLNWQALFSHNGNSVAFGSVFPTPNLATGPDYFMNAPNLTLGQWNLSMLIDLLEELGDGKILAEPNLTTISDQTAHFFAGGEFPILIPQGGGGLVGSITVEYKKYGVMLDFTPHVDLNGLITLHVVPEVSNLDKENAVILNGFVIPALLTRRADTIVKLWPGQSYLIGGMFEDEIDRVQDNLYWFSKIPILGPLFSSQTFLDHKTDLMIVVTPYLINNDFDSRCVSELCVNPFACPPCQRMCKKTPQKVSL